MSIQSYSSLEPKLPCRPLLLMTDSRKRVGKETPYSFSSSTTTSRSPRLRRHLDWGVPGGPSEPSYPEGPRPQWPQVPIGPFYGTRGHGATLPSQSSAPVWQQPAPPWYLGLTVPFSDCPWSSRRSCTWLGAGCAPLVWILTLGQGPGCRLFIWQVVPETPSEGVGT